MQHPKFESWVIGWCAASFCAVLTTASGCGTSSLVPDDGDASVTGSDGSAGRDAHVTPSDDSGPVVDGSMIVPIDASAGQDAGVVIGVDAGTPIPLVDAGSGTDPHFVVDMTFTTANIGRTYATRADVAAVFDHVANVIGARSGPRFVGWQEIGEDDPCGDCELEELRARFAASDAWETLAPSGDRPGGGSERVKVPVTTKGAGAATSVRAVFASPGWAGVSPTRFVTVAYYAERNISFIDTHFIAGAWSCGSQVAQRRDYWRQAWGTLQDQVAREHDRGRNVVVTGDLNRARATDGCNPAWDPTSLHPRARVVGGTGIDYVFVVPAAAWSFTVSDGGSIHLGIDGHEAHWVAGHFEPS